MATKFTAKFVENAKPGVFQDSITPGLYLIVGGERRRSWSYRYVLAGRHREMGLGSATLVTLAEARQLAHEARRRKADGIDPIEARRAARKAAEPVVIRTFGDCLDLYVEAHSGSWRGRLAEQEFRHSFRNHAPDLLTRPVAEVRLEDVLPPLQAIWRTKPLVANALRNRIERILDYSSARGWRPDTNPARWRGGKLSNLLPAPGKLRQQRHHKAMPYQDLPSFMAELALGDSVVEQCVQFLILTGSRGQEARGARFSEVDFDQAIWTCPAERTKRLKPHRVPLSDQCMDLVRQRLEVQQPRDRGLIFPSPVCSGDPLTDMGLLQFIKRRAGDYTIHGFRSSFRDWIAETTDFPNELAELALAHAIGNQVEAAYRRGDQLVKRRALMAAWGSYCCESTVVPFRAAV